MNETDVFIHSILFGIKQQQQEKKQDKIRLNNLKTNDWLFRVETALNIERFKRNPELWKSVYDAARNYQDKEYLLNRYTYENNGKRYWKQYEWKELKQDETK